MLARTRGASDEHRLGGERVLDFERTVRPFTPQKLSGSSFVVSRKRGLKAKGGRQISLEHPVGCCGGWIDTGGGRSGLLAVSLGRTVR